MIPNRKPYGDKARLSSLITRKRAKYDRLWNELHRTEIEITDLSKQLLELMEAK